jgi:hypothetical protein
MIAKGEKLHVVPKMPSMLGILVYAYSRTHMYDEILSRVKTIYAMDTDSSMIPHEDYVLLSLKYPELFGNQFGQFKEELYDKVKEGESGSYPVPPLRSGPSGPCGFVEPPFNYLSGQEKGHGPSVHERGPFGYFIAPKCYCFYKENSEGKKEIIKMRFKGVKTSSDEKNNSKEFTDDEFVDKMMKGDLDTMKMHDIYYNRYKKFGGNPIGLQTYERLLKGSTVKVLCSNIEKKVARSNEALVLRNRFVVKIIDPINSSGSSLRSTDKVL